MRLAGAVLGVCERRAGSPNRAQGCSHPASSINSRQKPVANTRGVHRVNEFVELADWFGWRSPHDPVVVDSLPTPTFTVKNTQQVSFSTNNYLGIATSPR